MDLRLQLMIDYYVGGMLHVLLKPLALLMGKLLRRNHDLKRCSTVTIVKMLGGGSLVIAYPALLAIKNAPHVKKLQLLTTPAVQPFAATLAIFDSIIVVRTDSPVRLVLDSVRAIRLLFLCDAIVDLEVHSRLTTVFSVITCARNRIGFYTRNSFWRRQLATHLLFCNLTAGIYHYYDQIAALFGGKLPHAAECQERFRAAIGAPASPEPSSVPRIALSPCCSDLSRERMLRPQEWVVALRRRLSRDGEAPLAAEIHLFGAPRDRASLDELGNLLRRELPRITPVNHAGQTFSVGIGPADGASRRTALHRFRLAAFRPASGDADHLVLGPYRSANAVAALARHSRGDSLPETAVLPVRPSGGRCALPRE